GRTASSLRRSLSSGYGSGLDGGGRLLPGARVPEEAQLCTCHTTAPPSTHGSALQVAEKTVLRRVAICGHSRRIVTPRQRVRSQATNRAAHRAAVRRSSA